MTNKEKLMDMKKQLEGLGTKEAELKGQRKEILKTLKENFNVNSIEQAEVLLEELRKNGKTLDSKLQKIVDRLEEEYEWD